MLGPTTGVYQNMQLAENMHDVKAGAPPPLPQANMYTAARPTQQSSSPRHGRSCVQDGRDVGGAPGCTAAAEQHKAMMGVSCSAERAAVTAAHPSPERAYSLAWCTGTLAAAARCLPRSDLCALHANRTCCGQGTPSTHSTPTWLAIVPARSPVAPGATRPWGSGRAGLGASVITAAAPPGSRVAAKRGARWPEAAAGDELLLTPGSTAPAAAGDRAPSALAGSTPAGPGTTAPAGPYSGTPLTPAISVNCKAAQLVLDPGGSYCREVKAEDSVYTQPVNRVDHIHWWVYCVIVWIVPSTGYASAPGGDFSGYVIRTVAASSQTPVQLMPAPPPGHPAQPQPLTCCCSTPGLGSSSTSCCCW
jgi:hypothetical protein